MSKTNTVVGIITRKDLTHLEWVVEKDEAPVADEPDDGNDATAAADPPASPAPAAASTTE